MSGQSNQFFLNDTVEFFPVIPGPPGQIGPTGSTGSIGLTGPTGSTALLNSSNIWTGTNTFQNTLNISGLNASQGIVTDASKNLVSLQYTDLPTSSTIVSRSSAGQSDFVTTRMSANSNQITFGTGTVTTLNVTNGGNNNLTVPNTGGNSNFIMNSLNSGSQSIPSASLTLVTTGSTGSTLDYYEEGTFSITASQGITLTTSVSFIRIGKICTFIFPELATATGASANVIIFGSAIPSRLLPTGNSPTQVVGVYNSGSLQASPGIVTVFRAGSGVDGQINISSNCVGNTAFAGSGKQGTQVFNMCWITA